MDNLLTRGRKALNDVGTLAYPYDPHLDGEGDDDRPYGRPYAA